MSADHTVRSFDEELKRLDHAILDMGELTKQQLADAMRSMVTRDTKLGAKVLEGDARVDERALEVENLTVRLIALRQPMAIDLRNIIAALRISIDLERIADYAFNVAERILYLTQIPPVRPVQAMVQMGQVTQRMLNNVLDAYRQRDASKAYEVWYRDRDVDEIYAELLSDLRTLMVDGPQNIDACTDLLFITKSIERIGDHIKNVAEHIHYAVHGTRLNEAGVGAGCPSPGF